MDKDFQLFVRTRAGHCCEYCRLPETCSELPFHLDHIIARQHGGETTGENLALACCYCNRYKGPNVAGIDPASNRITPLFHPRLHAWEAHFRWDGPQLIGVTAMARATISLLQINRADAIAVRDLLLKEGVFVLQPLMVHDSDVEYLP